MKTLIQKISACEKSSASITIANALLWAAVILIASWLSRGSEQSDALFILILCASTTAFLFTDR